MTIRQRALVQTVLTMLGITAFGIGGALLSTLMSPELFFAILTAIIFALICYLVYSWHVTSLEMSERFEKYRKE